MDRATSITGGFLLVSLGASVGWCAAVVLDAVAVEIGMLNNQHFASASLLGVGAGALVGLAGLWLFTRPDETRGFRCRRCGYDLRRAISNTCPECGEGVPGDQQDRLRAWEERGVG